MANGKNELKLGRTEWTSTVSSVFWDLFPIFMAVPFMSADYFLYELI